MAEVKIMLEKDEEEEGKALLERVEGLREADKLRLEGFLVGITMIEA